MGREMRWGWERLDPVPVENGFLFPPSPPHSLTLLSRALSLFRCVLLGFSVVSHPQYLGATLSIWGALIVTATPMHVLHGQYIVGIALTVYYMISSFVEDVL